jgi:hypothetical protein
MKVHIVILANTPLALPSLLASSNAPAEWFPHFLLALRE